MNLPEVVYGSNYLYITNPKWNILLDFNAVDSLSMSGYQTRKLFFNSKSGIDIMQIKN
jgi:hypothetical protein